MAYDPKERNLFLAQQVDQESINAITKSIVEINDSDERLIKLYAIDDIEYKPKPIKLFIDSYGGSAYQMMGLLGVMKSSKVPVHTIVTGCAMSCGFLISINGTKRFGYKNSTYLYHQVSDTAKGTAKELKDNLIEVERLQDIVEKHTVECTKISIKKLKEVYEMKQDWYINSTEAKELGIIDEIL